MAQQPFQIKLVVQDCIKNSCKDQGRLLLQQILQVNDSKLNLFIGIINMTSFRSCSDFDCCDPKFILVVFSLWLVYLSYLFQFYLLIDPAKSFPLLALITTIIFLLSFWSYLAAALVQPGPVPLFYALYSKQRQQRKYCLKCHNFKPQRSHHCSKCNKCILNMDHHCPWISNCVGFDNRKYFLLFIFYLLLALKFALSQMIVLIYAQIKDISEGKGEVATHTVIRGVLVVFCLGVLIVLLLFFHMHMQMVFSNTTTLEDMIRQRRLKDRQEGKPVDEREIGNPYDMGCWYNFTQIFGQNVLFWGLPMDHGERLRGRGYEWDRNDSWEGERQGYAFKG